MKNDEYYLGIDPGTTITGFGIVKKTPSGLVLIDFGCIRLPTKQSHAIRNRILFESISELLDKHRPAAMAIETQFVHEKNRQVGLIIGGARGVITLAATLKNIPTYEYAPKTIKRALTGTGSASKYQMQGMIQHYFRLKKPPEPADAADAIALTICHYNQCTSALIPKIESE